MNKIYACEKCGMTYEQYWRNSVPCKVAGSGYHPFVVMDVSAQQSLHLKLGILRDLEAVSYTQAEITSQTLSTPTKRR